MTGLAYRDEGEGDRVALLVHGYPESSYMWRHLMPAIADAGWRAVAPDLAGFGDSPPDGAGTWEAHVERLSRFHDDLGLGRVLLITHDWGVLIGLRWACDNPEQIAGLVVSDGGFFADRHWHDLANVMRTPGDGEELMSAMTREALAAALPNLSSDALDEYWKGFDGDDRRRAHLELYRSGDFEKLAPYEGRLADLGVPSLIVWGADDRFASVKMAHRFRDELPGSELLVVEGAGHFVWEDAPQETARAVAAFLRRVP
jgi:pimeloyl-ACP methyl ester carboxylesterase